MAQATIFTSPMARKKPVEARYNPNTYRVISYEAENMERPARVTTFTSTGDVNIIGQVAEPNLPPRWDHRKNRPNATHVNFLRQDVKLLNEPVCDVHTKNTQIEQASWWPHRDSNEIHKTPEHPLDTTFRYDFQYRGKDIPKSTRHTANPHKKPAWGSVPVNYLREKDGKQRFWKEGISYEHQYNCRLDPQYPIRGKRHGGFVWDQFPSSEVDRMLHHYGIVADKSQQTSAKPTQVDTSAACQPACGMAPNTQAEPITKPSQDVHPARDGSNTRSHVSEASSAKPIQNGAKHVTVSSKQPRIDSLINAVQGAPPGQEKDSVQLPPIF